MDLLVFHGSSEIIEKPIFGIGNPHNDYGLGFYCTESQEMAMEWACTQERDGFANAYKLKLDGLTVCNLSSKEYHILNWLAILVQNRNVSLSGNLASEARDYLLTNFLPDYSGFDIIRGWRADDSYFSFARSFLNGSLSLNSLSRAMKLGKLGEQIVLKSEKAFDALAFCEAEAADSWLYYSRRLGRDLKAREQFAEIRKEERVAESIYITDIIRQEWKNDDKRLR